jgi:hypothetical protein
MLSDLRGTAVHLEVGAADIARLIGGQERNHVGKLSWLRIATAWHETSAPQRRPDRRIATALQSERALATPQAAITRDHGHPYLFSNFPTESCLARAGSPPPECKRVVPRSFCR